MQSVHANVRADCANFEIRRQRDTRNKRHEVEKRSKCRRVTKSLAQRNRDISVRFARIFFPFLSCRRIYVSIVILIDFFTVTCVQLRSVEPKRGRKASSYDIRDL